MAVWDLAGSTLPLVPETGIGGRPVKHGSHQAGEDENTPKEDVCVICVYIMKVWEEIIGWCTQEEVSGACDGLLMVWLCLAAAPSNSPVDTALLAGGPQVTIDLSIIIGEQSEPS